MQNIMDSDSEDELPPGWIEKSTQDGNVYFVNSFSKETQWTHPRTGRKKVIPKELPFGWTMSTDEEGTTIYVQSETGNKTYVDPRLAFAKEEKKHVNDFRQRFDGSSTAFQVLHGVDLSGKYALITGSNAGIGYETAKSMARHGCKILFANRNLEATEEAIKNIVRETNASEYNLKSVHLDLSSLLSVKKCALAVKAFFSDYLDFLILNAGVFGLPYTETDDHMETTFQVNHLSHMYLALLLEPLLRRGSRVVFVSSESHRYASLKNVFVTQNISMSKDQYSSMMAYNNSKLYNVITAKVIPLNLFYRTNSCQYTLGGELIARVSEVRDLGVTFDSRLTFRDHAIRTTKSAFQKLGFVLRNSQSLTPSAFRALYTALVRSVLETSAAVWSPHERKYILMLEKVQKKFLRNLYKKTYSYYPYLYPTLFLQGQLGYDSLETRRYVGLMKFVLGIIHNRIDCVELVGEVVQLYVPESRARLRNPPLMSVASSRTNLYQHSPIQSALTSINSVLDVATHCDVFTTPIGSMVEECKILSEEWKKKGICVNSLHPGNMVFTNLSKSWWLFRLAFLLVRPFTKSLQQAASTTVYVATAAELEGVTGLYFNNCFYCEESQLARDVDIAKEVFIISLKMIAQKVGSEHLQKYLDKYEINCADL